MRIKTAIYLAVVACSSVLSDWAMAERNDAASKVITLAQGAKLRIETQLTCGYGDEQKQDYIQCPLHSYKFPRSNQITDMIRVKTPIPDIENGTLCTWVSINNDGLFDGTLMSYSTGEMYNAFAVLRETQGATDKNKFRLILNYIGKFINTTFENDPTHLCISFTTKDGSAKIYIDGKLYQAKDGLGNMETLQGGGIVIVGQEQDVLAGGFDALQAFKGTITSYMFWNRSLSAKEIEDIVHSCSCPSDYVFSLDPKDIILYGNVTAVDEKTCPSSKKILEL